MENTENYLIRRVITQIYLLSRQIGLPKTHEALSKLLSSPCTIIMEERWQRITSDTIVKLITGTRRAWQSQTWGRPAPQVWVQNQFQEDEIPLAVMAGCMKKSSENASTIPEVMDSSTLKFKANFKFSRFFFGGGRGTPVPFGCVLVSLCQSLACVKISGSSTL